jgi:hypothetical protein
MNIKVIVIPEKAKFIEDTSYYNEVYINKKLGIPKLNEKNVKYVAPFWLDEKTQGVNRLFHIIKVYENAESTVIVLGNSFRLNNIWDKMGSHRKFEYHSLNSFNFIEIKDGILMSYKL